MPMTQARYEYDGPFYYRARYNDPTIGKLIIINFAGVSLPFSRKRL
jgi:hypothetical protein